MRNYPCHFILLILTIVMSEILYGQSGHPWIKHTTPYNYILTGIDFPGNQDSIGFMVGESVTYEGNGIILKTTDGGNQWSSVWTGNKKGLEGASFVDVSTGFVAGWPLLASGWSGFARTIDGGATWTSLPVDLNVYYFTDVVFKDASNGILLGSTNSSPAVWVTSNGGNSWSAAGGVSDGTPDHACHVSGDTYFLVDNAGHIKKSVNNGVNWTTVKSNAGLLTGIDFYNDTIGMACNADGKIFKTSNGGSTWVQQTIGVDIWHDFGWENQSNVFLCGTPELVQESTDGGATWQNSYPQSTYQNALYECVFTPGGTGFICGSQGVYLKRQASCSADFTASSTSVCSGQTVTYTDLSKGVNLTYDWWFEGGTPSSSSDSDPVITYNTPGVFDVRLIVTDDIKSDTLLKTDYIVVNAEPATPVIVTNGFILSSNTVSGNQWYLNDNLIQGATGQNWTAVATGDYYDIVNQNNCVSDTSNHIYLAMTGLGEIDNNGPIISPVSNDGHFTVRFSSPAEKTYTLTIYNNIGMRIYEDDMKSLKGTNNKTLDLSSYPSGVYFLEIQNDQVRSASKLLIRH